MTATVETGKLGEAMAKEYLKKQGYDIIEQNYRTKRAEIDIIAAKNRVLVFVEVRTKSSDQFGTPEETINYGKRQKLIRNAVAYVARKKFTGAYRIDAICIVLGEGENPQRIDHYENIVE